jgi:hypothetical protein
MEMTMTATNTATTLDYAALREALRLDEGLVATPTADGPLNDRPENLSPVNRELYARCVRFVDIWLRNQDRVSPAAQLPQNPDLFGLQVIAGNLATIFNSISTDPNLNSYRLSASANALTALQYNLQQLNQQSQASAYTGKLYDAIRFFRELDEFVTAGNLTNITDPVPPHITRQSLIDDLFGFVSSLNDPDHTRIDADALTLSWIVYDVELSDEDNDIYDVPLGDFELIVNFNQVYFANPSCPSIKVYNYDNNETFDGHTHPHVSGTSPCLGDYPSVFIAKLANGELGEVLTSINNMLRHYNPDSPYVQLAGWTETRLTCDRCGYQSTDPDYIQWSEYSQRDLCDECRVWSDTVDGYIDSRDAVQAVDDDHWYPIDSEYVMHFDDATYTTDYINEETFICPVTGERYWNRDGLTIDHDNSGSEQLYSRDGYDAVVVACDECGDSIHEDLAIYGGNMIYCPNCAPATEDTNE